MANRRPGSSQIDIPNDILLLVLELLYEDNPRILLATARVCKAWNKMTERLLYRSVDLTEEYIYDEDERSPTMLQRFAGSEELDQSHVLPYIWHLKFPAYSTESDMSSTMSRIIPGLRNIREITYADTSGIDERTAGPFFASYPRTRVNLHYDTKGPDGSSSVLVYYGPPTNVCTLSTTVYDGYTNRNDNVVIYERAVEMFPNLKHFQLLYPAWSTDHCHQRRTGYGPYIRTPSREFTPQDGLPSRRLESLEMVNTKWNKIRPFEGRLSKLVDWNSLTTIKTLTPRHLPHFVGRTPNLKRLGLSCRGEDLSNIWSTLISNFPLLEDLRLSRFGGIKQDVERRLHPSTSVLRSITLSGWSEDLPFSEEDWAAVATACPELSNLSFEVGQGIETAAIVDIDEADWLSIILGKFPNLKNLQLYLYNPDDWSLLGLAPESIAILCSGGKIAEAGRTLDLIQSCKVGCPLQSFTAVHGDPEVIEQYSGFDDPCERSGFPGFRYAISGDGMLKVTSLGGQEGPEFSVRYGVWKPTQGL